MKIQNNFFKIKATFDSVEDYCLDGLVGEERKAVAGWMDSCGFCEYLEEDTLYKGGWYYGSSGFYYNPENGSEFYNLEELEEGDELDRIADEWEFSEFPYIKEISCPKKDTEYFVVKDGKCLVVEFLDCPVLERAYEVLKGAKTASYYDFVSCKKVEFTFDGDLEENVNKWISLGSCKYLEPDTHEDYKIYEAAKDVYEYNLVSVFKDFEQEVVYGTQN